MRLGKLDNSRLEQLVLSKLSHTRPESLKFSGVGDDCAVLDLGDDLVALSCDPITAASIRDLGRLSVHVNCNDAAAAGAYPVGLLVTLLIPPHCTEEDVARVADDLAATAKSIGVDILGGHTEVTDSVTRMITVSTVVARRRRTDAAKKPRVGDVLIMTKWAALEGSIILAHDCPQIFAELPQNVRAECEAAGKWLSVIPEADIAAKHGALAMHDVTEGGVLGAAWELAQREGVGLALSTADIPVLPCTRAACNRAKIDPLRLIGSGSLLILAAKPDAEKILNELSLCGIHSAFIGRVTDGGFTDEYGNGLTPPQSDEIYSIGKM